MADVELRCGRCHDRHPRRRAPLIGIVHGPEILIPRRLSASRAAAMGVPRGGLWWNPAPTVDGRFGVECRRCHLRALIPRALVVGLTPGVFYIAESNSVTAAAAATDAVPSRSA